MYSIDQIVKTKKPHVCGSNEWKIVRLGADLKLECCGCKRIIMMASYDLDKRIIGYTKILGPKLDELKNYILLFSNNINFIIS